MKYWHGTPDEKSCKEITRTRTLRSLSEEELIMKYTSDNIAMPRAGSVYVSKDPNYALIYALGGNYAGSGVVPVHPSRYGCLFEIDVPASADIVVDEDELGELSARGDIRWLHKLGEEVSSGVDYDDPEGFENTLWSAAKDGEYQAWIQLGHLLHEVLSASDMKRLLPKARNYAIRGPNRVVHAYRIDKKLIAKMRKGDVEGTLAISERLF